MTIEHIHESQNTATTLASSSTRFSSSSVHTNNKRNNNLCSNTTPTSDRKTNNSEDCLHHHHQHHQRILPKPPFVIEIDPISCPATYALEMMMKNNNTNNNNNMNHKHNENDGTCEIQTSSNRQKRSRDRRRHLLTSKIIDEKNGHHDDHHRRHVSSSSSSSLSFVSSQSSSSSSSSLSTPNVNANSNCSSSSSHAFDMTDLILVSRPIVDSLSFPLIEWNVSDDENETTNMNDKSGVHKDPLPTAAVSQTHAFLDRFFSSAPDVSLFGGKKYSQVQDMKPQNHQHQQYPRLVGKFASSPSFAATTTSLSSLPILRGNDDNYFIDESPVRSFKRSRKTTTIPGAELRGIDAINSDDGNISSSTRTVPTTNTTSSRTVQVSSSIESSRTQPNFGGGGLVRSIAWDSHLSLLVNDYYYNQPQQQNRPRQTTMTTATTTRQRQHRRTTSSDNSHRRHRPMSDFALLPRHVTTDGDDVPMDDIATTTTTNLSTDYNQSSRIGS